MKLAFCLYHYFPLGGLQQDFLNIITLCHKHGHKVSVYTTQWQGQLPDFITLNLIQTKGLSNHKRVLNFAKVIAQKTKSENFDLLVGFNKIPGLDIYFAADSCFIAQAKYKNNWLHRLTHRYRTYAKLEKSLFSPSSNTEILLLSSAEKEIYKTHYKTPEERLHVLPPGIDRKFSLEGDRVAARKNLNLGEQAFMLLAIGSSFHTKGIDRALKAIAKLPKQTKQRCQFFIAGIDKKIEQYKKLSHQLGLSHQVHFLGAREDTPELLQAADLFIHLARWESAGKVIIEALVSGCPALVTENCGYANYTQLANAGGILPAHSDNQTIAAQLENMLDKNKLSTFRENALRFSRQHDFFSLTNTAVEFIESNGSKNR